MPLAQQRSEPFSLDSHLVIATYAAHSWRMGGTGEGQAAGTTRESGSSLAPETSDVQLANLARATRDDYMPRAARGTACKSVLWVDDDSSAQEVLTSAMKRRGFALTWKTSGAEALQALAEQDFDVMVTDLHMPNMDGLALCERVVASRPALPVVVITGFGNLEASIGAIRAGAYDFIAKPLDIEFVRMTLVRAVQYSSLREEVQRLRQTTGKAVDVTTLRGSSSEIEKVRRLIDRISDSNAIVLISGESGTGKELVAQALHNRSRHAAGPFIAINCAAMPEALLESELFGHVKGAFTDARTARRGLFLKANGGTLFLDEIGEMPVGVQAKLLRALQERKVRAVGGDAEEAYDARIITASNRDLEDEVRERRFREDLFYRIDVVRVVLPTLRARGNDVLVLAQHFIKRYAAQAGKQVTGMSASVAQKLLAYAWPGNVRELQNCIERAVAFAQFAVLEIDDLPEHVLNFRSSNLEVPGLGPTEMLTMDEVERRYILRVLGQTRGSKTAAASVLGFDRRTLHRKLERWGLPTGDHDSVVGATTHELGELSLTRRAQLPS
jgi:two-component system response regulator HydG